MTDFLKNAEALEAQLINMFNSNDGLKEKSSDFDLSPLSSSRKIRLTPAAVLILIAFEKNGPGVVLTRRAKNLKHHAGQISFPGGKVEKFDASEMETAIRESFEEVGLKQKDLKVLGMLSRHETVTGYLISPFVGLIINSQQLQPEVSEVSEIFSVPLKFLLNKDNMQVKVRKLNGSERGYYAIPYGPYYIWGATARIIKTFADWTNK